MTTIPVGPRPREARGQRERDRQPVRHADDDIADCFCSSKVLLDCGVAACPRNPGTGSARRTLYQDTRRPTGRCSDSRAGHSGRGTACGRSAPMARTNDERAFWKLEPTEAEPAPSPSADTDADREDLRRAHLAKGSGQAQSLWRRLGPGLITGAADDDLSGIGTYSVAGAQFGYGMLWLAPFCVPLMTAVQEMCGRIGAITGKGLAAVLKEHYPRWISSGPSPSCSWPIRSTSGRTSTRWPRRSRCSSVSRSPSGSWSSRPPRSS